MKSWVECELRWSRVNVVSGEPFATNSLSNRAKNGYREQWAEVKTVHSIVILYKTVELNQSFHITPHSSLTPRH